MLCTRCGKRPAVVFVTNNNSKDAPTVGYCLSCAKELGIKPAFPTRIWRLYRIR